MNAPARFSYDLQDNLNTLKEDGITGLKSAFAPNGPMRCATT
jgi:hypothetical protein